MIIKTSYHVSSVTYSETINKYTRWQMDWVAVSRLGFNGLPGLLWIFKAFCCGNIKSDFAFRRRKVHLFLNCLKFSQSTCNPDLHALAQAALCSYNTSDRSVVNHRFSRPLICGRGHYTILYYTQEVFLKTFPGQFNLIEKSSSIPCVSTNFILHFSTEWGF